jgi:sugar lactone lactonase YvrE
VLAVDAGGNLVVADQANNRIRRIEARTGEVTTIAGTGEPGFANAAEGRQTKFNNPSAVAVGASGDIYVVDSGNGLIRCITGAEPHAVTTLAGPGPQRPGFQDGVGTSARFRAQMGLCLAPTGELIVADTQVYTLAGSGRQGITLGSGDVADIVAPAGLACAPDGRIFVSDSLNQVVRSLLR